MLDPFLELAPDSGSVICTCFENLRFRGWLADARVPAWRPSLESLEVGEVSSTLGARSTTSFVFSCMLRAPSVGRGVAGCGVAESKDQVRCQGAWLIR